MKIIKGDNVKVISGKDRGKTGTVSAAYPATGKIMIEGINVFKKNSRPKKQGEKGQLVNVSRPMTASKVMIEGSRRVRYCKKCKSNI
jgi:large subunit ribosomal protein L24